MLCNCCLLDSIPTDLFTTAEFGMTFLSYTQFADLGILKFLNWERTDRDTRDAQLRQSVSTACVRRSAMQENRLLRKQRTHGQLDKGRLCSFASTQQQRQQERTLKKPGKKKRGRDSHAFNTSTIVVSSENPDILIIDSNFFPTSFLPLCLLSFHYNGILVNNRF